MTHLAKVALDEEHSRAWLASLATELGAPREEHDEHPLHWRKGSRSDHTNCVELAWPPTSAAVRDSKNPPPP
ncbi:DUF397 domain-containing protein [Actinophytocola sp.]|uniref:DUF397 domain-containing protein n=1 Tax=Actinophytocola sp. TaxID=1872138 RepID=UPI0039C89B97